MEIFEPEFGEDNLRGSSSWSSISSPAHTIIDDSNISNWGWPCPDESCACEQNWNGVLSEERVLQSTPDNDSAQVMREILPQVLRCFSRNQHRASDARSVVFQKLTCSCSLQRHERGIHHWIEGEVTVRNQRSVKIAPEFSLYRWCYSNYTSCYDIQDENNTSWRHTWCQ